VEKAYSIIILGKVQGVSYRYYAKQKALEIGIKGWIKNLDNGNVEAFAVGNEKALRKFFEWCKAGPEMAEVRKIELNEIRGYEKPESFKMKYRN